MKRLAFALIFAFGAAAAPHSSADAQGIKGRELLGVRIGGVVGSEAIRGAFGNGSELELHFIKGFGTGWGVGLALSSHNFGASKDTLGNIAYLNSDVNREVRLSVFSITGTAVAMRRIGGRFAASAEGGFGLYAVTASIPAGLYLGTRTENRFGLYGGAGMLLRISRGFSFDLNVKYHYIFLGDDRYEPIHFYTGGTSAHFVQIALGVLLFGV